jgi:hypothetical protein
MKKLIITQEIWKEGNMYTSYCPELDVASCGRTIEEAQKNFYSLNFYSLSQFRHFFRLYSSERIYCGLIGM